MSATGSLRDQLRPGDTPRIEEKSKVVLKWESVPSLNKYKNGLGGVPAGDGIADIWKNVKEELKAAEEEDEEFFATFDESFCLKEANETQIENIYRVLLDYLWILQNHIQERSLTGDKEKGLFTVGLYFIKLIISTDKPVRSCIDLFSDYLLRHSVNNPPSHVEIFNLEEMKQVFDLFATKLFPNFDQYVRVFRSKKQVDLRLFRLFQRNMPMDLPLDYATPIKNPLDIPELRQFLLKPGQIYFSEEEIKKIISEDRLDKLSLPERRYIEERLSVIARQEAINKVLSTKLSALKDEVHGKVEELKEQIIQASK